MTGCCDPSGYDDVFGAGFARRTARKYRRRGLDRAARRMVEFLAADGIDGATVLEIGGGVGEVGIELLRRGAAEVTTLELSSSYDEEARRLAEQAGVAGRSRRRIVDIAAEPDAVPPADLVVLHRVVCCYPDHERLLGAAADHCRRRLAFSHPRDHLLNRVVVRGDNLLSALARRDFRAYVHPPDSMLGVLESRGLRQVVLDARPVWQVAGLTR